MDLALDVVGYVNLAIFLALGFASWRMWHVESSRATAWSSGTFGLLAATLALAAFIPDHYGPDSSWLWATKLVLAGLVCFPYFLYRFMTAFNKTGPGLDRFAVLFTAAVVVWSLALSSIPQEGEARSPAFTAYLLAFLAHWTLFSSLASYRLWQAGRDQPVVARRRMRLLAAGAIGLTLALILAVAPSDNDVYRLGIQLLATVAAVLFFLGVSPPALLRTIWRGREIAKVQQAISTLFAPTTKEEIAAQMLPQIAAMVGAQGASLRDKEGVLIGEYHGPTRASEVEERVLVVALPGGGELQVQASALTPFFGQEEASLVTSLAVFIALALERASTLAREREARARLEEVSSLKDTLLSAVSHELRTPLTAVLGFAMTLQNYGASLGPERTEEVLDQLVQGARRLESLLADLLDLDRLNRGVLEPRYEQVDFSALVSRTVVAMELEDPPTVEAEDVTLAVDVAKVERIIENLVYNAAKHTPDGARIWVRVFGRDGEAELVVEDDGPGVPEDLKERIFEPFQRGRLAVSHAPGTGIGLALVQRFADLHGGRAWVTDRPGGGASFHVTFPAPTGG